MFNRIVITRTKFILSLVLVSFSTLFFSVALVFGSFNTTAESGFSIDYIPQISYTATAINTKLKNTANLHSITFDYDDGVTYEDIKATGTPYVDFTNYTGTTPISSYAVATETTTDVYFLCEDDIIAPTNCSSMFREVTTVTNITFNNFDTSSVINMNHMFYETLKLEKIIFSDKFDTGNVERMNSMFGYCNSLKILKFGNNENNLVDFKTTKVTTMSYMFWNCTALESLKFSENFTNEKLESVEDMFLYCSSLTSLDVSNFNTSNISNMGSMFSGCSSLTSLDVSNFDTANVTSMGSVFSGCSSLTSLDVSNFDTTNVTSMGAMFKACSSLTSLDVSNFNTSNVTNMGSMFSACSSLTCLDVRNFNTSQVTRMCSMFANCKKLQSLDVSGFNTSQVEGDGDFSSGMYEMFSGCNSLTSLDVSSFNTSKVTTMAYMFEHCWGLTELDLSNFDTSNVQDMSHMFNDSYNLKEIDLSNFNTSNVTNMSTMFGASIHDGSSSSGEDMLLENVIFGNNFNTSKVLYMSDMFINCVKLKNMDLSRFDTSNVTNMSAMFYNCNSLQTLDLSSFKTTSLKNTSRMFAFSSALKTIYVNEDFWSVNNVTNSEDMFYYCYKLVGGNGTACYIGTANVDKTYARVDKVGQPGYLSAGALLIDSDDFNDKIQEGTANTVEKIVFGYKDDYASTVAGLTGTSVAKNGTDDILMYRNNNDVYILSQYNIYCGLGMGTYSPFKRITSLKLVEFNNFNTSNVTSMKGMFYYCSGLQSLDLSNFKTSNVTTMGGALDGMFEGCSSLTDLDVSNFDTSNVTNMRSMFEGCSSLTSLDLNSFNTSNVTDMGGMFSSCSNLTSLYVTNFNTANVTDMNMMFYKCSSLTSLDLNTFNTSAVEEMSGMFYGCSSLTSLNLSTFDTENVTILGDMFGMFENCKSLKILDLSSFKTSNITDMDYMFNGCSNLTTIYVDETKWSTVNVTSSSMMFYGCRNLVGGAGTTYNSSYVDKTYARVDGGTSAPGYLTGISYLVAAKTINTLIKGSSDELVASIQSVVFDYAFKSEYSSIVSNVTSTSVALDGSDAIRMYRVLDSSTNKYDVYILSDYCILAPEDCSDMFIGLSGATEINLYNFNTSKVTNMSRMFAYCPNVTSLNFGNNFTTRKVTNMYRMFYNLTRTTTLDISSFETTSLETIEEMFNTCQSLVTIYADPNKWIVDNVTNKTYTFINSHKIVGGQGTTMPAGSTTQNRGGEFARVDGGTSNPGYFTDIADKP